MEITGKIAGGLNKTAGVPVRKASATSWRSSCSSWAGAPGTRALREAREIFLPGH